MSETTKKRLPGQLMMVTAILFFITALIGGSERRGVFVALGSVFLCIGAVFFAQARRKA